MERFLTSALTSAASVFSAYEHLACHPRPTSPVRNRLTRVTVACVLRHNDAKCHSMDRHLCRRPYFACLHPPGSESMAAWIDLRSLAEDAASSDGRPNAVDRLRVPQERLGYWGGQR